MGVCKLHLQLAVAAVILQVISWYLFYIGTTASTSWASQSGRVILGSICMAMSLAYIWAFTCRPSASLNFLQFTCFVLFKIMEKTSAQRKVRRIEASWKTPRQHQEQLLLDIIKENGGTEYGRRYDLQSIRSLDDFRERHPLTTYEHYRAYVERMMDGEENVLTRKKPTSYVRTTGTTGQSKFIPYVSRLGYLTEFAQCMKEYIVKNYPSISKLKRSVSVYVHPKIAEAKSGAKIETIGTFPDIPQFFMYEYTTPKAGFQIRTTRDASYVHFLFGLRESDVAYLNIGFMTFLESALNQLKETWKDLVRDLETGTINQSVQLPAAVRVELTTALGKGDPQRASQLRREFEKGFDGILKRIWPNLVVITAIDHTGLWPNIEETFAKGISHMHAGYGSSEGFFAANLGRLRKGHEQGVGYVPFPSIVIIEFIKVDDIYQSQPKTYLIDEVEVGQCYEIVLTQGSSGLYRYRLGDVVKVIGFHENCPVIDFVFRIGQILNLHYEKVDQKVVDDAIRASVARWPGRHLIDYTVAESTIVPDDCRKEFIDGDVPYYIFFIELHGDVTADNDVPVTLSGDEKAMVDEELRRLNKDYDRLRREGSISHPRVKAVRSGAFSVLQEFILENTNATQIQFKSPRKLRSFEMFRVMTEQAFKGKQ